MTARYAFARDAFRVWLRKNVNAKFRRCASGACPLAIFAIKGCGFKKVTIDQDEIHVNGVRHPTKNWMSKFINEVDEGEGRVTGREAYRILNKISRGRNG